MKILHVTTFGEFSKLGIRSPEKDFGGGIAKTLIPTITYAKRNKYYESIIVYASECAFVNLVDKSLFNITRVNSFWIKLFNRPIVILLSVKDLIKIIKKNKIDVIHSYNFAAGLSAGIAGMITKKPMVTCVHQDISDYVSKSNNLFKKTISRLRRALILVLWRWISSPLSKKILPVSDFVGKTVQNIGISNKKLITVYNGLDINKFTNTYKKNNLRDQYGIKKTDFLIGSVGRLVPIKGYKYLIESASLLSKKYSNLKFIIIGDGENKMQLKALIKEKEIENIFFLAGHRSNIEEILHSFDIFVLSSISEGLPTVLLEAMCAKIPVIATNVGGVSEIVTDKKTGFIVEPKKPERMAKKIEEAFNNREITSHFTSEAYKMVYSRFTIKNKVETLNKIYHELINQN
jgi:glycosyltransferase involved in cell wall biosynthesis